MISYFVVMRRARIVEMAWCASVRAWAIRVCWTDSRQQRWWRWRGESEKLSRKIQVENKSDRDTDTNFTIKIGLAASQHLIDWWRHSERCRCEGSKTTISLSAVIKPTLWSQCSFMLFFRLVIAVNFTQRDATDSSSFWDYEMKINHFPANFSASFPNCRAIRAIFSAQFGHETLVSVKRRKLRWT